MMEKLVLGIDEAGRGAVIGPMVIAGAMATEEAAGGLKAMGARDSKELDGRRREELYRKFTEELRDYVVLKVPAKEIDRERERKNLNEIEAEKMAEIIRAMEPDVAYVDAPQASTEKFRQYLLALIEEETEGIEIVAENKADEKYPICSAASIIAKVERDWEIEGIEKMVGKEIGVGYPHDQKTIEFLEELLEEEGEFPDYVRKSWITAENLLEERDQRGLDDFDEE